LETEILVQKPTEITTDFHRSGRPRNETRDLQERKWTKIGKNAEPARREKTAFGQGKRSKADLLREFLCVLSEGVRPWLAFSGLSPVVLTYRQFRWRIKMSGYVGER
jgi:hypothetical protein